MSPRLLLLTALLLSALSGCSARQWYDGAQTMAKQNCQRQPPSEREQCEARLSKDDYDTYEKQRTQMQK